MKTVVAWHGSPAGQAAARVAVARSGPEDEVVLVRVVAVDGDDAHGSKTSADRRRSELELEEVTAEFADAAPTVRGEVLQGLAGPAEQILRYLEHTPADLLAVGVRRRSPVGKALLGSVSQDLLLGATVDVLAVKDDRA